MDNRNVTHTDTHTYGNVLNNKIELCNIIDRYIYFIEFTYINLKKINILFNLFHKRERRIKGQNSSCMLITKLDKYAVNKEDCCLIFLMSIYENIPLKIVIKMSFLVLPLYCSPNLPSHYFLFSSPLPSPLPFPFHFSPFLHHAPNVLRRY